MRNLEELKKIFASFDGEQRRMARRCRVTEAAISAYLAGRFPSKRLGEALQKRADKLASTEVPPQRGKR